MGAGTTGCSVVAASSCSRIRRCSVSPLKKTLNEEGEADHELTGIAERQVNVAAAHA
jgi:hypothetical protein